jgi:antitoxin (DNA-binding transcriptional repressor) of toxin-antitoxin stability system
MKTLTATKARQNLSAILSRALRGEDIGIVCEGEIVALRPVKVYSEDYALIEYGLTDVQMKRIAKNLNRQGRGEKWKVWDGTPEGLCR